MKILILLLISLGLHAQVKIPAKIQAENFAAMRLITVANIDSAAGTRSVSFIRGAWASYSINVLTPGKYLIDLMVADASGGATTEFRKSDGSILGDFKTVSTGGMLTYKLITDTITLTAGSQTIRINNLNFEYNLDWFEIRPFPTEPVAKSQWVSYSEFSDLQRRLDSLIKNPKVLNLDPTKFRFVKVGKDSILTSNPIIFP